MHEEFSKKFKQDSEAVFEMKEELKGIHKQNLQRTYQCEDLIEKIEKRKKDNLFLTSTQGMPLRGLAHKPSYSTLEKANKDVDSVV